MIKDLRKICGYCTLDFDRGICFHPLNFNYHKDMKSQPSLMCSPDVCPFMNLIDCEQTKDVTKYLNLKTQKARDYLLV